MPAGVSTLILTAGGPNASYKPQELHRSFLKWLLLPWGYERFGAVAREEAVVRITRLLAAIHF